MSAGLEEVEEWLCEAELEPPGI
jgi:hypothetical protein